MTYDIQPLGDQGLCISWGNTIDVQVNALVLALTARLQQLQLPAVLDLIPAYSSLCMLFDARRLLQDFPHQQPYDYMRKRVALEIQKITEVNYSEGRSVEIPVCYDQSLAPDLERIARQSKLDPAEIIRLHSSRTYRVYMLGFLPGFPYMGTVDDRIATPRLASPRPLVPAGSVGIAGSQTGIYPLDAPGGWNLIGRTPLRLFDPNKEEPALLRPGDQVRFTPISLATFQKNKTAP
ncbi:MAG: 5-oxoprolinase subunit PxpB [Lewinellaceae bacterium]|nr:5-oxoprolinase subunit PxpB [Lewinellaceae bacterium]